MKVIIVGCGKVGTTIAKNLTDEKHDVVIIDKEPSRIEQATQDIDCMAVVGNGAIQSVLIEAGINDADFLIACTSTDEINILTCLIAKKTSNCKKIARIRNPEYAKQIEYIMSELDISITFNPEFATANEISRLVRYPSSISSDSFFKGQLRLLQIVIPENSKIINTKLNEIPSKYDCNLVVCAIERGEEIYVPSGNFTIKEGDKIGFVADHNNALKFFSAVGLPFKQLNSFLIIGGSKISQYLISLLIEKMHNPKIKLIDKDKSVCEEFVSLFPNISVLCADAINKNTLLREGLNDVDAVITLTGLDEENIMISLFASLNNKTKIITKINHLNFVDSIKQLDIGSVVNPVRIASNIITSFVRASGNALNSNVETLYRLFNGKIEALGFIIKRESEITGKKFKDIKMKKNIIVAGIYRDNKIIIPNGSDYMTVGDSVVVISKEHVLNEITDILEK